MKLKTAFIWALLITLVGGLIIGLASCSGLKLAQSYVQKHCAQTRVTNPLTGIVEIEYRCDSLYNSAKVTQHCSALNICFDAVNGSLSGYVRCDSLSKLVKPSKK